MIDDLLGELFGEVVFGRLQASRRAQLILRLGFGLLGFGLCAVGAYHFTFRAPITGNLVLRTAMAGVFVFLGLFWLLNVALGRQWKWPGLLFVASFVSLFIARIVGGP